MHELALVRSIYSIVDEKMREYGASRVLRVKIVAGMLTGVENALLASCFEVYVQNTPVEGASLVIERVPVRVRCRDCGNEYETGIPFSRCAGCGNENYSILAGKEFYIDSLEVEGHIPGEGDARCALRLLEK